MTAREEGAASSWMLRAAEKEQLSRIADRIRKRRRILAILACETAYVTRVSSFLSHAARTPVAEPLMSSADGLLQKLEEAVQQDASAVVSLSWAAGDRAAMAALNLHREKLRRGASILLWCAPGDLATMQTEGQDVYSFRDTMVLISGFAPPAAHVPDPESPQILLARARLELPGDPYEKALAGADLATLLVERSYFAEAVNVCREVVEPFVEDDVEEAGRGTLAHLAGAMATALAASGAIAASRSWAMLTYANGLSTGALDSGDAEAFLHAIEPTFPLPSAPASVLHAMATERPWESMGPDFGRCLVSLAIQTWTTSAVQAFDAATIGADNHDARSILARALGDVHDATQRLWWSAEKAARRDEDNRAYLLRGASSLLEEGEVACAARLVSTLRRVRPSDWLPSEAAIVRAEILMAAGKVEDALNHVRLPTRPAVPLDGVIYRRCEALGRIAQNAFSAGRLPLDRAFEIAAHLENVATWLPPNEGDSPPFYRVLLPRLRASLLRWIPERRAEAARLAEEAYELSAAEVPSYAPSSAAMWALCLFESGRHQELASMLAFVEPMAQSADDFRSLCILRALHWISLCHTQVGPTATASAETALREAIEATGSPRRAAEMWLFVADFLPPALSSPDPLRLAEEAAERFAEMPMPANQERCREVAGDVLLARGLPQQAATRFRAAESRLRQYGLLLRVPLLRAKAGQARQPAGSDLPKMVGKWHLQ